MLALVHRLKIIFSFLLSYPLSGLLKRVPDSKPYLKNIFIICTSLFYLVGLFDLWDGIATLLISSTGTYCIAKYLRRSPYMPWIGFVFVMGHMSLSHIRRQIADSAQVVDISGAQMVLVMKLSAFCWNVADGQLEPELLSDFQKDRSLKSLPPILDFAGYILFFPSLLAGPAFDYAEYRRWIDTSMFDVSADVDPAKRPPVRKKRKIPRSGTPAVLKALRGLIWIGLYVALSGRFGYMQLLSEQYARHGLLYRIWIMYMVNLVARFKYYGVWTLTEGSCILAGLGYNGVDPITGRISWNRLQNIDPWVVETAQNPRAYLAGWNMNTNNWLRNYIYLRVTPRDFRRFVRPFFLDPVTSGPSRNKKYYDVASYLATQLTFSFVTTPFLLLSFGGSVHAWAQVYYYAFVWTVAALVFFASPGKAMLKAQLEKAQETLSVTYMKQSRRLGQK
ncbi:hypothetical protein RJ55_00042 [Drechmeria coniospora]|nr:hypothetical protein RJ55_00042 [Drechmeria coniospora]